MKLQSLLLVLLVAALLPPESCALQQQTKKHRQGGRIFFKADNLGRVDLSLLQQQVSTWSPLRVAMTDSNSSLHEATAMVLSDILQEHRRGRRLAVSRRLVWKAGRHANNAQRDNRGHIHVRFEQELDGLEVVDAAIVVHMDGTGRVYAINGEIVDDDIVDTNVQVGCDQAMANVLDDSKYGNSAKWLSDCRLKIVIDNGGIAHKAWERMVGYQNEHESYQKDKLYASIVSGAIVAVRPQVMGALRLMTMNCSAMPCRVVSTSKRNLITGDSAIDKAHKYAKATYNFFWKHFGRDSIDGKGMRIVSHVHVGKNLSNAHWDGAAAGYGDGNFGYPYLPFSESADIVAHELTHGITQYTSRLYYQNEAGALNEAMSDIFGACVDRQEGASIENTWIVGDAIFTPDKPSDGIRYMANPSVGGGRETDFYPERYQGKDDSGGVHYNSGIMNLAFVLAVQGGSHPRGKSSIIVPAIDSDFDTSLLAAARIFYMANTACLTPSSGLYEARECTLLFAGSHAASVEAAWAAVGNAPMRLKFDEPVMSVSAALGDSKYFVLRKVRPTVSVTCTSTGGNGDVDLFINIPGIDVFGDSECSSSGDSSSRACSIGPSRQTVDYMVTIHAVSAYTNLTLTCTKQRWLRLKTGQPQQQRRVATFRVLPYLLFDGPACSTVSCEASATNGVVGGSAYFAGHGVARTVLYNFSSNTFAADSGFLSFVSPNVTSTLIVTLSGDKDGFSGYALTCTILKRKRGKLCRRSSHCVCGSICESSTCVAK